jgi:hypothetical protein
MNYQKSYLKYKKKYLALKNQYGGTLLDDISNANKNIRELASYSISIPSDIMSKLKAALDDLNRFYEAQGIRTLQLQETLSEEEREKRQIPFIFVKCLWINFYKKICDEITAFHSSIMSQNDDSKLIRDQDINLKLQAIHNLLLREWNYYLPPAIEDIYLPPNNLQRQMLISQTTTPVILGFNDVPRFVRKTIIPFDESMEQIIFEINRETTGNQIIQMVFPRIHYWSDYNIEGIHIIINKMEELFKDKKYSDLQNFFQLNEIYFVNLIIKTEFNDSEVSYYNLGEVEE